MGWAILYYVLLCVYIYIYVYYISLYTLVILLCIIIQLSKPGVVSYINQTSTRFPPYVNHMSTLCIFPIFNSWEKDSCYALRNAPSPTIYRLHKSDGSPFSRGTEGRGRFVDLLHRRALPKASSVRPPTGRSRCSKPQKGTFVVPYHMVYIYFTYCVYIYIYVYIQ